MARPTHTKDKANIRAPKTELLDNSKGLGKILAEIEPVHEKGYYRSRFLRFFKYYFLQHAGQIFLYFLVVIALSIFTYVVSLPQRYDLKVGDVSPVDITSTRDIVDRETTQRRAEQASLSIPQVYTRSVEEAEAAVARVQLFYALVDQTRSELKEAATPTETTATTTQSTTTAASSSATGSGPTTVSSQAGGGGGELETTPSSVSESTTLGTLTEVPSISLTYTPAQIETYSTVLMQRIRASLGYELLTQHATMLVSLEDSFYQSIKEQSITMAQQIMAEPLDRDGLNTQIEARVAALTNSVTLYKNEYATVGNVLSALLKPNVMLDDAATATARETEISRIMNSPTMIPAGTRILNVGDVIDTTTYNYLTELNLIQQSNIEYFLFLQIFVLIATVVLCMLIFLQFKLKQLRYSSKDLLLIALTVIFTYILSAFLSKISVYAAPIYFLAIVLTMHFSFEIGFVISALTLIASIPFVSSAGALFPILFGLFCISLVADVLGKIGSNAWLIVVSLFSPGLMVIIYGALVKNPWSNIAQNALYAGICGALSAVAALGIQPVLEVLSSTVSATHLIKLAQPSQPLLRRLFLEAPGTYQHSMMVANLAEKGAEVIGADPLLVRVGAYYHDIGKMDHPEVFTENQTDYNPHDYLSPQESVSLIIGHVEGGLKTARRHRLPVALQQFIKEHHGNTLQASFFYKAQEEAEANGEAAPKEEDYRYPWPIPSSKETAIVMLADSLEAAIRSTQTKDLAGAEKVARNIVKIKNEQNQLINSGLSYQEVEALILSFVQTYQGQFHERVRYPDARPVSKHPKQIQPADL